MIGMEIADKYIDLSTIGSERAKKCWHKAYGGSFYSILQILQKVTQDRVVVQLKTNTVQKKWEFKHVITEKCHT